MQKWSLALLQNHAISQCYCYLVCKIILSEFYCCAIHQIQPFPHAKMDPPWFEVYHVTVPKEVSNHQPHPVPTKPGLPKLFIYIFQMVHCKICNHKYIVTAPQTHSPEVVWLLQTENYFSQITKDAFVEINFVGGIIKWYATFLFLFIIIIYIYATMVNFDNIKIQQMARQSTSRTVVMSVEIYHICYIVCYNLTLQVVIRYIYKTRPLSSLYL